MNTKEYLKLDSVEGSLIALSGVEDVAYGEIIDIVVNGTNKRRGKVVMVDENAVIAQVFQGTQGISVDNTSVRFTGHPLEIPLSRDILGRTFNGLGMPVDDGPQVYSSERHNVNGRPMNPISRSYHRN